MNPQIQESINLRFCSELVFLTKVGLKKIKPTQELISFNLFVIKSSFKIN